MLVLVGLEELAEEVGLEFVLDAAAHLVTFNACFVSEDVDVDEMSST